MGLNLWSKHTLFTSVLMSDGRSEYVAHVWSYIFDQQQEKSIPFYFTRVQRIGVYHPITVPCSVSLSLKVKLFNMVLYYIFLELIVVIFSCATLVTKQASNLWDVVLLVHLIPEYQSIKYIYKCIYLLFIYDKYISTTVQTGWEKKNKRLWSFLGSALKKRVSYFNHYQFD